MHPPDTGRCAHGVHAQLHSLPLVEQIRAIWLKYKSASRKRSKMSKNLPSTRAVSRAFLVPALALGTVSSPALAQDDARKAAYGRHLAQQCTTCHRTDGVNNGIPVITGWPSDQFVAVLESYKMGDRRNEAMVSIAQTMGVEEMQALALHFSRIGPGLAAASQKAPAKKK